MKANLSKLSIGFNANVEVIERNVFEITGDVKIEAVYDYNGCLSSPHIYDVDKLKVVYNHDGLLEHIYDGNEEPDKIRLFKDVETYVAMANNTGTPVLDPNEFRELLITESNAINVYATITLIGDECY